MFNRFRVPRTREVFHLRNRISLYSLPVFLRPLLPSDAPEIAHILDFDWNFSRTPILNIATVENGINDLRRQLEDPTRYTAGEYRVYGPSLVLFAISLHWVSIQHPKGRPIGVCGIQLERDPTGRGRRYGTIKFAILPEYMQRADHRDGAIRLLIDWAFRTFAGNGLGLEALGLSAVDGSRLVDTYSNLYGLEWRDALFTEQVKIAGVWKLRWKGELARESWQSRGERVTDPRLARIV